MKQFEDMYRKVTQEGVLTGDRTGTGTRSIFGHQMRFDLSKGFPLVTGKKVSLKMIKSELLWFLRGNCDEPGSIEELHADGCHIWDEWKKPDGSLGPIYGTQWRKWGDRSGKGPVIDQVQMLMAELVTNPTSRRMVVSAWNPTDIDAMALPPCHVSWQLRTRVVEDEVTHVDMMMTQRSCDTFLGVPYNVASYALLLEMICVVATNNSPDRVFVPGEFVWSGGDVHIYNNHTRSVAHYMAREKHPLPKLRLNTTVNSLDEFRMDDIELVGYKHSGSITAPVSV